MICRGDEVRVHALRDRKIPCRHPDAPTRTRGIQHAHRAALAHISMRAVVRGIRIDFCGDIAAAAASGAAIEGAAALVNEGLTAAATFWKVAILSWPP
jgi:hypothetical protein